MFFTYKQNNSFGKLIVDDKVGNYVIIEEDDFKKANKKAKQVGLYFDGCDNKIDCQCCGDRWFPKFDKFQGDEEPYIHGVSLKILNDKVGCVHVYFKNGDHIVRNY